MKGVKILTKLGWSSSWPRGKISFYINETKEIRYKCSCSLSLMFMISNQVWPKSDAKCDTWEGDVANISADLSPFTESRQSIILKKERFYQYMDMKKSISFLFFKFIRNYHRPWFSICPELEAGGGGERARARERASFSLRLVYCLSTSSPHCKQLNTQISIFFVNQSLRPDE